MIVYMGDDLPFQIAAKHADRWAVIAAVVYKLGGWFIFSVALVCALWIVWTSREGTTTEYITELRNSRDNERVAKTAAYEIISQNSQVLSRMVKAQEDSTKVQQELIIEIKRRNDRAAEHIP